MSRIILLVSFFNTRSLTNIMVQGRMGGNWLLSRLRWGHFANGGGWGEGCHAGLMGHLMRERRDSVGRWR
jgi:hypothetical protein